MVGDDGILLRLEPGADPIAGELIDRGGEPQRFLGWMQLTTLIERARARAAPADDPARQGDGRA
jgi:hypothetical protein